MADHLVIFDTQIKPGSNTKHLGAIGNYIVTHRPDKIIMIGDHWDMHSLSSYDKGTLKGEATRYQDDIKAGISALRLLFKPLRQLQDKQKASRKKVYKPMRHFCLGNHEERIARYVNYNPTLKGKVGYDDLKLERFGFTVHDYLTPVILDGIEYVHYVQGRNSPRAKVSSKVSMEQTKMSVTQGHRPCLDIHTDWSDEKGMMWSITCGSSYLDDEDYKGAQGNQHWRGILHKRNVQGGDYDPTFLRLSTLMEEYSD